MAQLTQITQGCIGERIESSIPIGIKYTGKRGRKTHLKGDTNQDNQREASVNVWNVGLFTIAGWRGWMDSNSLKLAAVIRGYAKIVLTNKFPC